MKNTPPARESAGPLKVDPAQAGMKLLRFLERALGNQPQSALHKWIRTGQVRVNGKRARAFDLLRAGDEVRLPPFAKVAGQADCGLVFVDALSRSGQVRGPAVAPALGPGLDIVAAEEDYLVLAKAGGLPSQGGSGHADSVAGRLALAFAGAAYLPAPAHRLDRDSSGLLLAGLGFAAQKALHALFRSGGLSKDYLVWTAGPPPFAGPALLADRLQIGRDPDDGREKAFCLPDGQTLELCGANPEQLAELFATFFTPAPAGRPQSEPAPVRPALSLALPLGPLPPASGPSLLLLRLFTGRKHQIRVQLAARGHHVLGDLRYGPKAVPGRPLPRLPLLLHAWRLRLAWSLVPEASGGPAMPGAAPAAEGPDFSGPSGAPVAPDAPKMREYRLLPAWPPPFAPPPPVLEEAACRLDALVGERLTAFLPKPGLL